MKEARFLRILRLPLITLLAINLAVLLIAPLYRARPASDPRSTEQAVSSVVGREPIAPAQDETSADQDEEKTSLAADEPVVDEGPLEEEEKYPTGRDESAVSSDVGDEQETIELPSAKAMLIAKYDLDLKPLFTVGQQLSLPKSAVEPFSRPVARVAGRLSQWLAVQPRSDHVAEESPWNQSSSASPTASRFVSETDDLPHDRIVLRNPRENRLPVAFLLDEQVQTLEPGSELVVHSVRANIRFDRGGVYGESRLVLEPGLYRFDVGSQGWRLQSEEAAPE